MSIIIFHFGGLVCLSNDQREDEGSQRAEEETETNHGSHNTGCFLGIIVRNYPKKKEENEILTLKRNKKSRYQG